MYIQEMNRFSIRDIENLTGIKAHTLRIWELRYGILQPKRTDTNIRYYDGDDLKSVLRISLLNNYGYKISLIHQMSDAAINKLIAEINNIDFQLQALVNELLQYTIEMNAVGFEKVLNNYIKHYGIEAAVEELIFAFLEKIGIMWMTNRIFPAQEHLVSNIIFRKITLAVEKLPFNSDAKCKVLLFLPEGEIHDIGLMYAYYLLRKHNKQPIYLGPNSPMKDVKLAHDMLQPKYIYVHLTSANSNCNIIQYLQKLCKDYPKVQIIASGAMLKSLKLKPIKNLTLIYSLQEAHQTFASLT